MKNYFSYLKENFNPFDILAPLFIVITGLFILSFTIYALSVIYPYTSFFPMLIISFVSLISLSFFSLIIKFCIDDLISHFYYYQFLKENEINETINKLKGIK